MTIILDCPTRPQRIISLSKTVFRIRRNEAIPSGFRLTVPAYTYERKGIKGEKVDQAA
jgi:hypothetical protein